MRRLLEKSKSSLKSTRKLVPDGKLPAAPLISQVQRISGLDESSREPPRPEIRPSAQPLTPESIRRLREIIRLRYALDTEIWSLREAKSYSRGYLNKNIMRSAAVMENIKQTLQDWVRREYFSTDLEHVKFQEIKRRLIGGHEANWLDKPPWKYVEEEEDNSHYGPWEAASQPITVASHPPHRDRMHMGHHFRPVDLSVRQLGSSRGYQRLVGGLEAPSRSPRRSTSESRPVNEPETQPHEYPLSEYIDAL